MSELRMGDVRARGCGFTLGPAAREAKVDESLMFSLLDAAEYKFSHMSIGSTKRKRRPYWPQLYTKHELLHSGRNIPIEDLITAGLITPASDKTNNENYFLTKKSLDIFLRAKKINEKLQRENFHYCPCSMF